MRYILAMAFMLISALALSAETISYVPGARTPKLDIYGLPADQAAPVMIFIHGGGWVEGSRRKVFDVPAYFNAEGYVFVSIGYTLVPDATVEQELEEIDQALAWITQNIGDYGGDASQIYLMGHSAGAHLTAMSVLQPLDTLQNWLSRGALKAVICNDVRAYDLPALQSHYPNGTFTDPYAMAFGQERGRLARLSPQLYLGGNALEGAVPDRATLPPFMVNYSGGEMRDVFSLNFAEALRADGVPVSVFAAEGYTHGEMNKRMGQPGPLTDAVEAFLAGI